MTGTPQPPDRLPWEKAKGESTPAFQAFALYRDLGPERSIPKVAQDLSKSIPLLKGWSRKHHWVERAEAYDRHVDHKRLLQTEDNWLRAKARHEALYARITNAALRRIAGDNSDPENPVPALDPADMDWGDAIRAAHEGMIGERLIHGQPTDFALRVVSISREDAIQHLKIVFTAAREIMDADQYQQLLVAYVQATGMPLDRARVHGATRDVRELPPGSPSGSV